MSSNGFPEVKKVGGMRTETRKARYNDEGIRGNLQPSFMSSLLISIYTCSPGISIDLQEKHSRLVARANKGISGCQNEYNARLPTFINCDLSSHSSQRAAEF